jgi:hypothetical protein
MKESGFLIAETTKLIAFFRMFDAPFRSEWSLCPKGQLITPLIPLNFCIVIGTVFRGIVLNNLIYLHAILLSL